VRPALKLLAALHPPASAQLREGAQRVLRCLQNCGCFESEMARLSSEDAFKVTHL
jgi:hypothetical protein